MATDVELLQAWRSGDDTAGNELFDRYFAGLFRFFRNKVSDGVDDLVQKTFLACVTGRDRLRDDASFRTYVFSTARKLLYLRYRQAEQWRTVDFELTSIHDLDPSPSRVMAKKAEQRLLLEGLRRIPLQYQIVLELYYWEGMTGPELAAALGIPVATVRSRIHRGTEQLRRKLEAIAEEQGQLQSTLTDLEGWAKSLRERLGPAMSAD